MIDLNINIPDLKHIELVLGKFANKAPKIVSRVINRVISNVNKNISKNIRKRYIVKTKDIKKTISIKKATRSSLNAYIRSNGQRVMLFKFKTSPQDVSSRKGSRYTVVKAKVLRESSLKPIEGFIAKMKSGHLGVFERLGKEKLKIKELVGPAIPQMLGNKKIIETIKDDANKTIKKRMMHEIKEVLKRR